MLSGSPRVQAILISVLALATLVPLFVAPFYLGVVNYLLIISIATLGLVALAGFTGMVSLGQAAFMGIGAYTTAKLTASYALSPLAGLLAGQVITIVVAAALSSVLLRLRGHYFVLGSVFWQVAAFLLFLNVVDLTGGPNGITAIPRLFSEPWQWYYVLLASVTVAVLLLYNLNRLPMGPALHAIRADEQLADSMGVPTYRVKFLITMLAASFAAYSGWLYAHYQAYVNPGSFNLAVSIKLLVMAVVGGIRSPIGGGVLGPLSVGLIDRGLQDFMSQVVGRAGSYELAAYGALMMLLLNRLPGGLAEYLGRFVRPGTATRSQRLPANPTWLDSRSANANGHHAMEDKPLISVRHVHRNFGGLQALRDVSFDLRRGEILALIGPNGAGKSTLFNVITGLLPPSKGILEIKGQCATRLSPYRVIRLGIARTFQHPKLIRELTCLENVALGAYVWSQATFLECMFGLGRAKVQRRMAAQVALASLARVGLTEEAFLPAGSLPAGKQRLLEIARALASGADVLLLDEPAAGLRAAERQALSALLRELRDQGFTIMLVEHDMSFVSRLADRVIVLNFGSKIAEGPFDQVRQDPEVLRAYLGGEESAPQAKRRPEGACASSPLLRVSGLQVFRGVMPVVKGVSLEVNEGEVVGIIGPNGAGKSSTLLGIMGILSYHGRIEYLGQPLMGTPDVRTSRGLILVPEGRELFNNLSVEDNLILGAYHRIQRDGFQSVISDVKRVYELFPRLMERRRQLAGTLSGGEQQMLAIGRALAAKPRVLMLDEPSMGLAPLLVKHIFDTIQRIAEQEKMPVLLVEQNSRLALSIADRAYVLENGEISKEGPAVDLLGDHYIQRAYLGVTEPGRKTGGGSQGGSSDGRVQNMNAPEHGLSMPKNVISSSVEGQSLLGT